MTNPAETLAAIKAALDKLEALEKAATKGPWVYDERGGCCAVYPDSRKDDTPGMHRDDERNVAYSNSGALFNGNNWDMDEGPRRNLHLIAASRSFVPGALVYMRAEHKAVSEMVSGLEERDAAIPRFIHDWIARLAAALGIEVQP